MEQSIGGRTGRINLITYWLPRYELRFEKYSFETILWCKGTVSKVGDDN